MASFPYVEAGFLYYKNTSTDPLNSYSIVESGRKCLTSQITSLDSSYCVPIDNENGTTATWSGSKSSRIAGAAGNVGSTFCMYGAALCAQPDSSGCSISGADRTIRGKGAWKNQSYATPQAAGIMSNTENTIDLNVSCQQNLGTILATELVTQNTGAIIKDLLAKAELTKDSAVIKDKLITPFCTQAGNKSDLCPQTTTPPPTDGNGGTGTDGGTTSPPTTDNKISKRTWYIIGGIIAGVLIIAVIGIALYFGLRKKPQSKPKSRRSERRSSRR